MKNLFNLDSFDIKSFLSVKPKDCNLCNKKCKTKRGCLIGQMLLLINSERLGGPYKPLSYMALSRKLAHLTDYDIEVTHSLARDYRNRQGSYSKYLFGALKAK